MNKILKAFEMTLPISVAIIIAIIVIIRLYYAYTSNGIGLSFCYVTLSFPLPMLIIAVAMIYLTIKGSVSSGYLASSGIMAACSIRHFSEIVLGLFEGYSLADPLTYIILGLIFLVLSYILFRKGQQKGK